MKGNKLLYNYTYNKLRNKKTISYVNQDITSYRVSVSRACVHGCNGMLPGFSRRVMAATNQR